jgi:hypothetical protein
VVAWFPKLNANPAAPIWNDRYRAWGGACSFPGVYSHGSVYADGSQTEEFYILARKVTTLHA